MILMLSGRNGIEADSADNAGIAESRLGRDNAIGDEVVEAGMLLLLHIQHGTILKGPLNDIGVGRAALDELALLELRPELREVLELDEVPDVARVGFDDGGDVDGGGCWDCRHFERVNGWVVRVDGWVGGGGLEAGVGVGGCCLIVR